MNIDPTRRPSSWHFSKLLQQIREIRGFSVAQASQCLPFVKPSRFEDWEDGRRLPPALLQTLIVWRLNTAPEPKENDSDSIDPSGRIFAPGLPLIAFVGVALGTLIFAVHRHHQSSRPGYQWLAEEIAHSAWQSGLVKGQPSSYYTYAKRLESTILTFTPKQRNAIFGSLTARVESSLGE